MSSPTSKRTVRDFGYDFDEFGVLKKLNEDGTLSEQGFQFNISSDDAVNQKNYEILGEAITDYVYNLLEENGFHKIYLSDKDPIENSAFVFSSQAKLERPKKLMILIHGSGVVRAGQWARSLIINQSIDHGTMLPYIKKAKELGYEILITNGNDIYRMINGKRKEIRGSRTPEDHAKSTFEQIVFPANPESIAIVAHSYGGIVTISLARQFRQYFQKKVFALAFTDSVHFRPKNDGELMGFLKTIGRNFVASKTPLNEKILNDESDIPTYSAGHTKHEWTSYSCKDVLFDFLEEKYEEFTAENASKKARIQ